jgi:hypothetical protein
VPYVIQGNTDSDRISYPEFSQALVKEFFAPLARGAEFTPEILSKKPQPYFVTAPAKGGIPEIFGENLGVWTVKENVKNLIEELEPGIHCFLPVDLRVKGLDKDWGQFVILRPGQVIDAIVIDETDFREGKGCAGFSKSSTLSSFGNTVLNGQLIEGRHLWRGAWGRLGERTPFEECLFCSDELAETVKRAGMEGWRFRRCKLRWNS